VSYAVAGYIVTVAALGGYALRTLRRGRRLARTLPADERTWK
jgi:hypothetical protein